MAEGNPIATPGARRTLSVLAFLQFILGILLIILWSGTHNKEQNAPKTLGLILGSASIICACVASGVGVSPRKNVSAILGEGMAILTCLCSLAVLVSQAALLQQNTSKNTQKRNSILVLIPILCFLVNVMEILCFAMFFKNSTYQQINNGVIIPRESPSYQGQYTIPSYQEAVQSPQSRPPAYSNPPPYSAVAVSTNDAA